MDSTSDTHEVTNQPPPLVGYDAYTSDRALREAVRREGAAWADEALSAFGRTVASEETLELGVAANRFPPELRTHDPSGRRLDTVVYHPAYHALMRLGVEAGIHAAPWARPRTGAHVARGARHFLLTQAEASVLCPLTMTFAAVPALRRDPAIAAAWEPRLRSFEYDPSFRPAAEKRGCTVGMAMTEKQGGSDVRANTTRAARDGEGYRLVGHKWFCSAPMSDAFLTLAYAEGGLTCFVVPRFTPDGTRNAVRLMRLKDKLGNRANASSEVEYHGAWAERLGEEGRGVATILEMVAHTRLDCTLGSAGLMRQALAQAAHHARHRLAFGRRLIEQPLMQNVLADLALESEAATALALRVARAYDQDDPAAAAWRRIATAVAKYWVCKRTPPMVAEALECLGGSGYVEESILPRLYREAPLSSIWEGSGNVMCLDVLRALGREPETGPALLEDLRAARGADRRYDRHLTELETRLTRADDLVHDARRLVEELALALQASILLRHAPPFVADAFCAGRLGDAGTRAAGHAFGTLPSGLDLDAIIERAAPW